MIKIQYLWFFLQQTFGRLICRNLNIRKNNLNTNFLNYLFIVILSVAIVASLQTVGIILVLSMLLIPAAASKQITNTFVSSIYVSILFGVFSSVSGLYLSYFFNLPSGPTMSMVATFLFVVCFFVSQLKKTKI